MPKESVTCFTCEECRGTFPDEQRHITAQEDILCDGCYEAVAEVAKAEGLEL